MTDEMTSVKELIAKMPDADMGREIVQLLAPGVGHRICRLWAVAKISVLKSWAPIADGGACAQLFEVADGAQGDHQSLVSTIFNQRWTGSYGQEIY